MSQKNNRSLHVAVIGAGALGGWSAFHLQKLGYQVTLIDMADPGNIAASSGGETRVIRSVYGSGGHYTALIPKALEQWQRLEKETQIKLFHKTGVLWMHQGHAEYIQASMPHLQQHGFDFQPLSIQQATQTFPVLATQQLAGAFWEPNAGVLMAKRACKALADYGISKGMTFTQHRVHPGNCVNGRLQNLVGDGAFNLKADYFVFACGPWLAEMFPAELSGLFTISKQDVFFFSKPTKPALKDWRELPVWIEFGDAIFYGLPDLSGTGLKVALDERGPGFHPDQNDRLVDVETLARIREFLALRFPELATMPLSGTRVCQYTNTHDGELLVDVHPDLENVVLLGGGSGHAFKLGPVIGDVVAGMINEGQSPDPHWRLSEKRSQVVKTTQFERTN